MRERIAPLLTAARAAGLPLVYAPSPDVAPSYPQWQRRFVVYERRRDLPRVGIAALAAEAYLPFTGRDRE